MCSVKIPADCRQNVCVPFSGSDEADEHLTLCEDLGTRKYRYESDWEITKVRKITGGSETCGTSYMRTVDANQTHAVQILLSRDACHGG